jgi:hypothetical protein
MPPAGSPARCRRREIPHRRFGQATQSLGLLLPRDKPGPLSRRLSLKQALMSVAAFGEALVLGAAADHNSTEQ